MRPHDTWIQKGTRNTYLSFRGCTGRKLLTKGCCWPSSNDLKKDIWLSEMGKEWLKTVQVTDSKHPGVVSEPE